MRWLEGVRFGVYRLREACRWRFAAASQRTGLLVREMIKMCQWYRMLIQGYIYIYPHFNPTYIIQLRRP